MRPLLAQSPFARQLPPIQEPLWQTWLVPFHRAVVVRRDTRPHRCRYAHLGAVVAVRGGLAVAAARATGTGPRVAAHARPLRPPRHRDPPPAPAPPGPPMLPAVPPVPVVVLLVVLLGPSSYCWRCRPCPSPSSRRRRPCPSSVPPTPPVADPPRSRQRPPRRDCRCSTCCSNGRLTYLYRHHHCRRSPPPPPSPPQPQRASEATISVANDVERRDERGERIMRGLLEGCARHCANWLRIAKLNRQAIDAKLSHSCEDSLRLRPPSLKRPPLSYIDALRNDEAQPARSIKPAAPMPPPTHIVITA